MKVFLAAILGILILWVIVAAVHKKQGTQISPATSPIGTIPGIAGPTGSSAPTVAKAILLTDNGGRVDWSADGKYIAFDRRNAQGYYDVWIMDSDGTGQTCLTCGAKPGMPTKNKGNPAWDPSGQYIVFQAQRDDASDYMATPGKGVANELWAMTPDGSHFWKLVSVPKLPPSGILHPHFSRDGKKIFWAQLVKASLISLGEWNLNIGDFVVRNGVPGIENIQSFQPGGYDMFYESHGFTPDGKSVLFTAQTQAGLSAQEFLMNLSSGAMSNLTQTPQFWNEHGQLSPDGKFIVWVTNRDTQKNYLNMWIMGSDGSNPRLLLNFHDSANRSLYTDGGPADSSWSPDGKHLVVYSIMGSASAETGGKIFRVDFQ